MVVASSLPFAPLSWWAAAAQHEKIIIDLAEHYQKMSFRNRYYLAGTQGKMMMSIPLLHGRNQRKPVAAVGIANDTPWQDQHWKTIVSLYRRSPFFEYYEHLLRPLFSQRYDSLTAWNNAGMELIKQILKLPVAHEYTHEYRATYPAEVWDIRQTLKPQNAQPLVQLSTYYQVFAERCGFQPDCSILDLLFCEGTQALHILRSNAVLN